MELHHPNYIKNGITSSADKWKVTFSCLSFMIIVRIAITSFFRDCDVLKGLRFSINSPVDIAQAFWPQCSSQDTKYTHCLIAIKYGRSF